ncbi:MAG: bifunctional folylpolyglutamate synthase/dihydrofolate synthase [Proteobacteria bacterium]|nr:bifunctional folylpolyglutamate synthase/dihydrofolate synthase [Pseudomonadota bacterium]
MKAQNDYDRCLDTMYALGRFGIVLGLSTMETILENLGNPHKDFKSIHVAGTNGKGSVASSIAHILHGAGYKTGLYTSPHLVSFNERITINNVNISNDEVIEAFYAVEAANTGERSATFFEISTAMAFYMFSKKKVDFAIIETGMGGRLDATNIISPVLSIVTNISLEHKSYLGSTLAEIAGEKAGIIKHKAPVISAATQDSVISVIRKTAQETSSPFYLYRHNFKVRRGKEAGVFTYYGIHATWHNVRTRLLGRHQVDNAALALAASELLMAHAPLLNEQNIRKGLESTTWAGRLEIISQNPMTLVDGAHNLMSIHTLSQYLKETFSGKKITLVTGILDDKAYSAMFKCLLPLCCRVVLTRAKTERSIDPNTLLPVARALCADATVIDDIPEAIRFAESKSAGDDVICISGSLYVVGEAKAFFNERAKK